VCAVHFDLRKLMPRRRAMILFGSPAATSSSTSRSPVVSNAARASNWALSRRSSCAVSFQCSDRSMRSSSTILAQRFLDEIESAGLYRRNRQRSRAMAGNEDHWDAPAANVELLLEFKPGHPRHLHVEQQATDSSRVVILSGRRPALWSE
jgi:hypothetical protein